MLGLCFFQVLGEAMTGISNSAKQCQFDQFCQSVGMFADSISGLAEAIVQVCPQSTLISLAVAECLL